MIQQEQKISHQMDVTPEQAWEVIGSVGGVDKWFGSMIKSCKIEGKKRICVTADGTLLNEDILEVDHKQKRFRFAIPEQSMLPVQNIVETMQVTAGENGKAVVEWAATFEGTEADGTIAKEAFQNLWTMGLNEMEAYINK